ncbi:MAG: hypothetical protein JWN17_1841 [Frankiales bacterium]|nr:hypothetical protein [Frankiales bacterium]
MHRSLVPVLLVPVLVGLAGVASASSPAPDASCATSAGVTTCATTTRAPAGQDVAPGRPGCTVVTPVTTVTTTYRAHRGAARSSGAELPAPAPTVEYERGIPAETCAPPALTSSWSHAADGNVFFTYQGQGLVPSSDVLVEITFTNADGRSQTFSRTLQTSSGGTFGTGDQFHCDYQRAVAVRVTQGQTVLTAAGAAADTGACG